jgi:hypothetical protein
VTVTTLDGRRYRVLTMLGRWRSSDGAWRINGRERRDATGGDGMSPMFLNPPAILACPHCGEVQPVAGVDAVDGVDPGTLSRVAIRT